MSAQNLLLIVAVAVLLIGGGWYYFDSKKEGPENKEATSGEENTDQESSAPLKGAGSFRQLMGLGQNLTCDFSYVAEDTNGAIAGTVYVAGDLIRTDFDMMQAGVTYESHMIQDGQMSYMWTMSPQGTFAFKNDVSESDSAQGNGTTNNASENRSVDLSQEVDYDCRSWNVDNALFVPPADIEFMDPQAMMQGMMQGYPVAQ